MASRSRGVNLTFDLSEAATIGIAVRKFSAATKTWSAAPNSDSTLNGNAGANTGKVTAALSSP